jgi:hypothetical protein
LAKSQGLSILPPSNHKIDIFQNEFVRVAYRRRYADIFKQIYNNAS